MGRFVDINRARSQRTWAAEHGVLPYAESAIYAVARTAGYGSLAEDLDAWLASATEEEGKANE